MRMCFRNTCVRTLDIAQMCVIWRSYTVHSAYINTTHKLPRVCDPSVESLLTRIFRARFAVAYCGKILVNFLHEVSMERLRTAYVFLLYGHSRVQRIRYNYVYIQSCTSTFILSTHSSTCCRPTQRVSHCGGAQRHPQLTGTQTHIHTHLMIAMHACM